MSLTREQIKSAALELDPIEREALAERLQNKFGLDIFYHEPPPKGQ